MFSWGTPGPEEALQIFINKPKGPTLLGATCCVLRHYQQQKIEFGELWELFSVLKDRYKTSPETFRNTFHDAAQRKGFEEKQTGTLLYNLRKHPCLQCKS